MPAKKGIKHVKKEEKPVSKESKAESLPPKEHQNKETNSSDKKPETFQPEVEKKYQKRVIHDNWSKYEVELRPEDAEDANLQQENDFSFLTNQAASFSSHFQMTNEKDWEKQKLKAEDIFQLDLKALSAGLASVPFHERIGLNRSELTEADLERVDYFAKQSKLRYQTLYEDMKNNKTDNAIRDETITGSAIPESLIPRAKETSLERAIPKVLSKTDHCEDEPVCVKEIAGLVIDGKSSDNFIESLQNATKSPNVSSKTSAASAADDNLEDWLDSVLDD